MITKEEVEAYRNFKGKFYKACMNVCKELERLDYDYHWVEDFYFITDDDIRYIRWTGEHNVMNENCHESGEFEEKLLYLTDEELKVEVDRMIEKKENKDKKNLKDNIKRQIQSTLEKLSDLQKKYRRLKHE